MNNIITTADLLMGYKNAKTYVRQFGCPKETRSDYRNEMILKMDTLMVLLRRKHFTEVDRQQYLSKGKALYKDYCAFSKGHPEENTLQLEQRADKLASLLAKAELQSTSLLRLQIEEGHYLDARAIFSDKEYVREFLNNPIIKVIEDAIKNKKFGAIKEYGTFYSCKNGKKYHIRGCCYCKGKELRADYEQNYIREGLTPCKCVIQSKDEAISELQARRAPQYITAFVDESIRPNPGFHIDDNLEKEQALLSFIICKGKIAHEEQITKKNTIVRSLRIADKTNKTGEIALEAIGEVLLRAAAMGFSEHIVIYTDNLEAAKKWKDKALFLELSKKFYSVNVYCIDRAHNKCADKLIRSNDIMVLPMEKMKKLIKVYNEFASI